jgi:hypothetical protein
MTHTLSFKIENICELKEEKSPKARKKKKKYILR